MDAGKGRAMVWSLVAAAALVATVPLWAQESRQGDRILHRYFDVDNWGEVRGEAVISGEEPAVDGTERQAGRPAMSDGDAPGLWLSPDAGEWIWTPDGPLGAEEITPPHGALDQSGGITELDDLTDRVDALDYQASFQPSVVPFKRSMVQNRLRETGGLAAYLEPGRYEPVGVGGALRNGEERFWGSFLLRLEPDERHRIPSISPHQRVLTVQTEPDVDLQIERDGADNFYLSGPVQEVVRVNLELAVPRHYFDGALDETVGWQAFTSSGTGWEGGSSRAADVLAAIGVAPGEMNPRTALDKLVEYHRGFEARRFPESAGGDRYVQISKQRVGVCRHRSLTFMKTAQALGFATRYVYNEAHAFVELYWPGQGWRRIDLGGGADVFDYQGSGDGGIHDGLSDPEFPRPASYEEEMAELDDRQAVDGSGEEAAQPGHAQDVEQEQRSDDEPSHGVDDRHGAAEREEAGPEAESSVAVELLEADREVYRGEPVRVRGRVVSAAEGTTVQIVLVPSGHRPRGQGVELGEVTVGADGQFEDRWTVPAQVSMGRWRLEARIVDEPR